MALDFPELYRKKKGASAAIHVVSSCHPFSFGVFVYWFLVRVFAPSNKEVLIAWRRRH